MTTEIDTKRAVHAAVVEISIDGVPKLHCPLCNKALASLAGYVKHAKKHEPPGGFLCRYCEARFCHEAELKRHLNEVHITIACRICSNITFTEENDYREHIRIVHNGIDRQMFKCDKCGAEYKTIDPYRRHKETECGTIKPHKCDQCNMSFVTKYNLKQHKESHSGERKYCCSFCGKNFLQKGRLVEHERSHTGEKPYKCDVCGKCFAHRESIVTHSSIHTGIRLVECKCCLSRFSCYSNLIKHRRTRPDTCGQSQYDPPKNRIRTHRSRIPPTLNPTSEIKVSGQNKVIKPNDIVRRVKKPLRKENDEEQPAKTGPKKRGRPKSVNKTVVKKKKIDISSSDEEFISDPVEADNTNNSLKNQPRRSTRASKVSPFNGAVSDKSLEKNWQHKAYSESDEDNADFGAVDNNESEDERQNPVKVEFLDDIIVEEVVEDHSEFEYTDANAYNDDNNISNYDVKSEDVENIFSEKDQLIECLLNEDLMTFSHSRESDEQLEFNKIDNSMLQETEVIIVKNEEVETAVPLEEDILNINSSLPNTKANWNNKNIESNHSVHQDAPVQTSIKNKNPRSDYSESASDYELSQQSADSDEPFEKPKHKYTKRATKESTSDMPGRVAKLSQSELKARLKMLKKQEKSWQCPHCIKIYHMRKPYEKHLREDHQRPEQEIKEIFKTDELGVVNEDIFKCPICDKIYLLEKRLQAHVELHGPERNLIYKCPCYCSVYFVSKEEATAHAQKEHRDLLYCELCDKFMTGHDSLKNHVKNHHADKETRKNQRNLVCDKCGKKFSGRTSLTDHVRSDCGRVPLYQCSICGKHLTTAGILKTHMLLHKDDTPFQCEQCGKTFKVKAQYKTHLKTRHTDYKPFKCHLCPKAYPYRESLLTHMTVHTGIKRFLCNGCGKRFTCISNLQAHRKVHAETCGLLPLNAKATQYMGVQKGNLLLGSKPEAGLEYIETNTLIAKEVLDRDLPMAQELNLPSDPSAPLATVPLNCTQTPTALLPANNGLTSMIISNYMDDSAQSQAQSSFN